MIIVQMRLDEAFEYIQNLQCMLANRLMVFVANCVAQCAHQICINRSMWLKMVLTACLIE